MDDSIQSSWSSLSKSSLCLQVLCVLSPICRDGVRRRTINAAASFWVFAVAGAYDVVRRRKLRRPTTSYVVRRCTTLCDVVRRCTTLYDVVRHCTTSYDVRRRTTSNDAGRRRTTTYGVVRWSTTSHTAVYGRIRPYTAIYTAVYGH